MPKKRFNPLEYVLILRIGNNDDWPVHRLLPSKRRGCYLTMCGKRGRYGPFMSIVPIEYLGKNEGKRCGDCFK